MELTDDSREGFPSASNWKRYEACHGSYQLEQEARKLEELSFVTSEAASRGERIHAWLAGEDITLEESELKTAEHLREMADGEVKRIFGDAKVKTVVEKRLWLKHLT